MASAYRLGVPVQLTLTSSGLTTATTAYTSGDQLGAVLSLPLGSAGDTGGYQQTIVTLKDLWITDRSDLVTTVDCYFFNASPASAAGDNNAVSFSDADIETLCSPVVNLGTNTDLALNKTTGAASWWERTMILPAGTLYVVMVTKSAHTFFGAGTDIKLNLIICPEY